MPSGIQEAVPYCALIYLHDTSEVRRDSATILQHCFLSYFVVCHSAELTNSQAGITGGNSLPQQDSVAAEMPPWHMFVIETS